MTSTERRRCMMLLQRAQDGDEMACESLTKAIAGHFSYMIRGYSSVDPSWDKDDLFLEFQRGIWLAIARADKRGDPLYHIAWRGRKAVCSLLAVIKRRRHGTDKWIEEYGEERSIGTLSETWDIPDTRPESDPEYALEVREERDEAQRHAVYVLAHVSLTSRQKEVVDWMMTDSDPWGEGANLRLAHSLGVSPQMASKYRGRVIELVSGQDQAQKEFPCAECGRAFGSKSAFTQHKQGQSGHLPCIPAVVE